MQVWRIFLQISWNILSFCILLFSPITSAAPALDMQPHLSRVPLKKTPKPVSIPGHFDVRTPACIDGGSTFYISGKGLEQRTPRCSLVCNKTSHIKTHSRLVDDTQLKCTVKEAPGQGLCRLGARAGDAWLASKTVRACNSNKRGKKSPIRLQRPAIKPPPPLSDRPKPPIKLTRPRIASGFAPPPPKPNPSGMAPKPQQASPDGTTRRTNSGLVHTPRMGLAMTGQGDSTTRAWQPISVTVPLSLTMRGLGDSQTTFYPPIDLTVTTPLTMRGLYTGDY
jgi:hypothetical protein